MPSTNIYIFLKLSTANLWRFAENTADVISPLSKPLPLLFFKCLVEMKRTVYIAAFANKIQFILLFTIVYCYFEVCIEF